ncbi:MAG: hypothetical protein KY475_16595 [Planctomycetes bacterium]|nr:hypothetical protein [Planctomycetota bacterium]
MMQLDELECGDFQRGRPKERSRLLWNVSAREMASTVVEAAGDEWDTESENEEEDVQMETHYFPVRKGVQLELQLRADMTAAELDNLADFVKIVAASRRVNRGE